MGLRRVFHYFQAMGAGKGHDRVHALCPAVQVNRHDDRRVRCYPDGGIREIEQSRRLIHVAKHRAEPGLTSRPKVWMRDTTIPKADPELNPQLPMILPPRRLGK
jgi:hypothetical protein